MKEEAINGQRKNVCRPKSSLLCDGGKDPCSLIPDTRAGTCKDTKKRCWKKVAKNKCSRKPRAMLKKCALSCQFCRAMTRG